MGAGGKGAGRRLVLFVAILATALLVLTATVDLDGDPTTPNLPEAVLVTRASVAAESIVCSDEPDGEPRWSARLGTRVKQFRRRAERWTQILRRFHQSVITDIPI
ncbi:MAG TPA: hypothetical protein VKR22_02195 [Acidimicrobiales bacterium]|nr:hypothetical protein [Acidimicrobiales bacterium]